MIVVKKYKNRTFYVKGKRIKLKDLMKPLKKGIPFRVVNEEGSTITYEVLWDLLRAYGIEYEINPYPHIELVFDAAGQRTCNTEK